MGSVERFQDSQWQKLGRLNFSKQTVLSLIDSGTVLDIGCGDGILMEHLKQKGVTGVGIDISAKAISFCKERGLDCRVADIAEKLPFENGSFDTVILTDVLEHIFQPVELLREAHRVSRRDIAISVPNFASLPARVQMVFGKVPENNTPRDGHVYWMTKRVLFDLLTQAGFAVDILKVNTIWERVPLVGFVTRLCAKMFPSLFALSFIVKAHKV